jgi:hypothetical protein
VDDAQNAGGVAVWRAPWYPGSGKGEFRYVTGEPTKRDTEKGQTGRWFPEAEADALVAVAEAADVVFAAGWDNGEEIEVLRAAIDRLDAARGAK